MTPQAFSGSEALFTAASEVLATGVSSAMRRHVTPTPLYIERAEGPYFWDVDGHRLLDYTLAWGPLIVGSNHPRINAAVSEQLSRGYAFGAQHKLEITLAQQIVNLVPGVEQVIYSNSGTEAVQAAIRIARATTGRCKILKFEGHYHGWMNNVLVSYHPTGGDPTDVQPTCGGQPASEYAETIAAPWNDLDALERVLERHKGQIAAVITEPLLANSGSCEPKSSFLQGLIDLCRQHGAFSIFDEVITGFRIARGGARELYGVEPDLSVYGKALAAGFPLSAVGGRRAVFDVLRDGRTFHAGTYNGNPICLAAASATLSILAQPNVLEQMDAHGKALRRTIQEAADEAGIALSLSGVGAVFSVHWGVPRTPEDYRQTLQADRLAYTSFRMRMLNCGVYLLPDGRWYVGAAHDDAALELATRAVRESLSL
ncbi:MAG: aspartate aminotransferase family protein [Pirellulales bacterium]|nr:aspartate aminotransferase family protein [Pirellulales bacterium]